MEFQTEEDATLLQEDLSRILTWAKNNNMTLNGDQFELLQYGPVQELKSTTNYKVDSQIIAGKAHVKDLGVHMSSDMTFSHHINEISDTAWKLSGWILRTFQTRNKTCMLTLWKALVLPKLEYCCQLWSPFKTGDIIKLEAVQHTFTNKTEGLQQYNYWERLQQLGLYSLQRRRERYIIIYVWKILEHLVPNVGLKVNYHPRRGRLCYVRRTEGTSQRVKNIVHHSFTYIGARLFNSVPQKLRNQTGTSPESFKNKLDKWLATIMDQPPTPGYTSSNNNSLQSLTCDSERRSYLSTADVHVS
ncbi:uncharacterized protein LOC143041328 [Oratosquilla oratoria]|uniref:uncharacterized protein LOC143041328 n=1 Tax=Oratosquilla oratoria TaxID=337810 RepID=UPI003F762950